MKNLFQTIRFELVSILILNAVQTKYGKTMK